MARLLRRFDPGFGPFYVKFCGYFPFTGQTTTRQFVPEFL